MSVFRLQTLHCGDLLLLYVHECVGVYVIFSSLFFVAYTKHAMPDRTMGLRNYLCHVVYYTSITTTWNGLGWVGLLVGRMASHHDIQQHVHINFIGSWKQGTE